MARLSIEDFRAKHGSNQRLSTTLSAIACIFCPEARAWLESHNAEPFFDWVDEGEGSVGEQTCIAVRLQSDADEAKTTFKPVTLESQSFELATPQERSQTLALSGDRLATFHAKRLLAAFSTTTFQFNAGSENNISTTTDAIATLLKIWLDQLVAAYQASEAELLRVTIKPDSGIRKDNQMVHLGNAVAAEIVVDGVHSKAKYSPPQNAIASSGVELTRLYAEGLIESPWVNQSAPFEQRTSNRVKEAKRPPVPTTPFTNLRKAQKWAVDMLSNHFGQHSGVTIEADVHGNRLIRRANLCITLFSAEEIATDSIEVSALRQRVERFIEAHPMAR